MYLIDGYNLLYQTTFVAREELVAVLDKFFRFRNKKAIIVFDGESPDELSTDMVQVVFAGNADEELINLIGKYKGGGTLISSDNELQSEARKQKMKCINSEKFVFSVPDEEELQTEDDPDLQLSDSEAEEQLEEFNNFQK